MQALIVLGVVVGLALAAWLLYVAARRGRALRRQQGEWVVEQWAGNGTTTVAVRRRSDPERLTDQVVVAAIPDDAEDWSERRSTAWVQAQQRAAELNLGRP